MVKKKEFQKGEIIIYRDKRGPEIKVNLDKETIWLTQSQMADLFDVKRPAIVKHVKNIYKEGELSQRSTCSILEQVAADGKLRKMNFYNLDMIISVGYRVNSKMATQFRIWATKTLKDHLVKGYTINQKRLLQAKSSFKELQEAIDFLKRKSGHELLEGQEKEILDLLAGYSKTLSLLEKYDKEKLKTSRKGRGKFQLTLENGANVVAELKKELVSRREANGLFGQEYEDRFKAILGNIYQTFGGKDLYSSLEEKAAHLLYFIIKDHPFADGNKRIGSFLFVYFLDKNDFLYKESGEKKLNDNALTALALLIAVSEPKEKDRLIIMVTNLLGA